MTELTKSSRDALLTRAEQLSEQWLDALNRPDIEALVRFYREDIMFFGSLPDLFTGREGVRDYFTQALRSPLHAQMSRRQSRWVTDDVLAMTFFLTVTREAATTVQYRIALTLVENDGEWLIALHHGSLRP